MLSVHEVTTAYQGLVAISAVSIEVAKGEIVCVAGANGAGRTALLSTLFGCAATRAIHSRTFGYAVSSSPPSGATCVYAYSAMSAIE